MHTLDTPLTPHGPPSTAGQQQHCVGCPGVTRDLVAGLRGESTHSCGFDSLAVEARCEFPTNWQHTYGFGLVRRGYLIRQRTDRAGHTMAVDAVGPGCAFPLPSSSQAMHGGYALGRSLVCLCTESTLERALRDDGTTAVDVHRLDAETIARMERLADARGRGSAASKLAALLCTLADTLRPGAPPEQRVPSDFLQRDLAALLSIRHESVCRVLRGFIDDGLVQRDDQGLLLSERSRLEAV